MGFNPSSLKNKKNPVECVSWDDAQLFCKKLEFKIGSKIRLPFEAEWEYACRSGSDKAFFYGNSQTELPNFAWFCDNSKNGPKPVGTKKGNFFFLHDVHGNVAEWCMNFFSAYSKESKIDPIGPKEGDKRVVRDGSWSCHGWICHCSLRVGYKPDTRENDLGFRIVVPLHD